MSDNPIQNVIGIMDLYWSENRRQILLNSPIPVILITIGLASFAQAGIIPMLVPLVAVSGVFLWLSLCGGYMMGEKSISTDINTITGVVGAAFVGILIVSYITVRPDSAFIAYISSLMLGGVLLIRTGYQMNIADS